jgi:nucleoside-diphosphate-sugar epimerase
MPRALIAGCGYLGQALADSLTVENWEVECWTASPQSVRELSLRNRRAQRVDISNSKDVLAHKSDFDAVIHCASTRGGDVDSYRRVYLDGARNLIDSFMNSRILFTSSTSVYSQINGEWVSEESPAEPKQESGKILRDAENVVLAARGVIARLGGIYGPGRSAFLNKFLDGRAIIDAEHDRFVNEIHRDDAATAMRLLLKSAASRGEIYNVVDNKPILQSECYRWLAAKLNRPLPREGRSIAKRKGGESNKRVSNAKLRSLGWVPEYPTFAEGMEKSVLPSVAHESA